MGISIQKELYKLAHKKKYIVMLILVLLVLVIRYGMSYAITRLTQGQVTIHTNLPLEILPILTDLFVPIVMFMAVTDLIAEGIREDTLKADFMRPITREGLLFSKVIAVMVLSMIYMITIYIAAALMQVLTGGGYRHMGMTFAAYLIDIVPLVNIILLAVIVNLFTEKPALSMLLCLAVYAVLKYFSIYGENVSSMLFTSYLRWHTLVIGSSLPIGALLGKLGIIFGTMIIFGSAAVVLIDRKSI